MKWMRYLVSAATLAWIAGCGGSPSPDEDHTARMAREHAGDAPVAAAAGDEGLAGGVAFEVKVEVVEYADLNGAPVRGHLASPVGVEGAPGMLVIHEWWGLNDNIKATAERLAAQGYVALAVDLYSGQVADSPDAAMGLMKAAMASPQVQEDNLRQAFAFLKGRGATRIGSIGWCFGGGWSLRAALSLGGELDAAVIYYGHLITDDVALEPLNTPVLGIFGAADQGIPLAEVEAFQAALARLGKPAQFKIYPGAEHAFANPSGKRYDAEAARDAWALTLAFLDGALKAESR